MTPDLARLCPSIVAMSRQRRLSDATAIAAVADAHEALGVDPTPEAATQLRCPLRHPKDLVERDGESVVEEEPAWLDRGDGAAR